MEYSKTFGEFTLVVEAEDDYSRADIYQRNRKGSVNFEAVMTATAASLEDDELAIVKAVKRQGKEFIKSMWHWADSVGY
jgi:hypothetical protein